MCVLYWQNRVYSILAAKTRINKSTRWMELIIAHQSENATGVVPLKLANKTDSPHVIKRGQIGILIRLYSPTLSELQLFCLDAHLLFGCPPFPLPLLLWLLNASLALSPPNSHTHTPSLLCSVTTINIHMVYCSMFNKISICPRIQTKLCILNAQPSLTETMCSTFYALNIRVLAQAYMA